MRKVHKTLILTLSVMTFTLFSCKNGNSSEGGEGLFSFLTENNQESKEDQENQEGIRLIVGDEYKITPSWADTSYPATHVYFQVENYPKVELPFEMLGSIFTEVSSEKEQKFRGDYKSKDVGEIVFSFYNEYADAGNTYFAVEKDGMLRIYSQVISQEDGESPSFLWKATYDISAEPKLVALLDQSYYIPQQLKQDFFQPITYSDKEIKEFIKKHLVSEGYDMGTPELSHKDTKRFREFYSDMVDLVYNSIEEYIIDEPTFYKKWNAIYDIDKWGFESVSVYICGGDAEYSNISVDILEFKKDTYFCTAEARINYGTEYKGSCDKHLRIVQINGFLYFDSIIHKNDQGQDGGIMGGEILGDYPE